MAKRMTDADFAERILEDMRGKRWRHNTLAPHLML
jgi:hypothetical protein